jgi:hypothetical protein
VRIHLPSHPLHPCKSPLHISHHHCHLSRPLRNSLHPILISMYPKRVRVASRRVREARADALPEGPGPINLPAPTTHDSGAGVETPRSPPRLVIRIRERIRTLAIDCTWVDLQ